MGVLGDPFRPALGNDLTAMILQFAMYDIEARRNLFPHLCGDPALGLAHLYRKDRFVRVTGVELTGAGTANVNGWYRRLKACEGPPGRLHNRAGLPSWYKKDHRAWYKKDDGCFICYDVKYKEWHCREHGVLLYSVE